jgi:hypothetical protein
MVKEIHRRQDVWERVAEENIWQKRKEVTGECRTFHKDELHSLNTVTHVQWRAVVYTNMNLKFALYNEII